MSHAEEPKLYPKEAEKRSKGFRHGGEVARFTAVWRLAWKGPDWRQGDQSGS